MPCGALGAVAEPLGDGGFVDLGGLVEIGDGSRDTKDSPGCPGREREPIHRSAEQSARRRRQAHAIVEVSIRDSRVASIPTRTLACSGGTDLIRQRATRGAVRLAAEIGPALRGNTDVEIDEDVRVEYWTDIRGCPEKVDVTSFWALGKNK